MNLFERLACAWSLIFDVHPHISTSAMPCPACGNFGCDLQFDGTAERVRRTCKTCSCVVTQPPIYPSLFKAPERR